jgi:hypothetical protein
MCGSTEQNNCFGMAAKRFNIAAHGYQLCKGWAF